MGRAARRGLAMRRQAPSLTAKPLTPDGPGVASGNGGEPRQNPCPLPMRTTPTAAVGASQLAAPADR
jgi:hypothetical protein